MGDSTNRWTEAEDALIRRCWMGVPLKYIRTLFPGRTLRAVQQRAYLLRCTGKYERFVWLPEDDQMLKELWGRMPVRKIGDALRKSHGSTRARARHLGLIRLPRHTEYPERFERIVEGQVRRVTIKLDEDTGKEVADFAAAEGLSEREAILTLVEWGLETARH